jgi:restriction endonuclease S subunit
MRFSHNIPFDTIFEYIPRMKNWNYKSFISYNYKMVIVSRSCFIAGTLCVCVSLINNNNNMILLFVFPHRPVVKVIKLSICLPT